MTVNLSHHMKKMSFLNAKWWDCKTNLYNAKIGNIDDFFTHMAQEVEKLFSMIRMLKEEGFFCSYLIKMDEIF